jgi:cob(I)alamin adenosyltransferase
MSYRLTKIYTRKGDTGYTTFSGKPVSKDDALIETVGTLDELNAAIGLVMATIDDHDNIKTNLTQIQHELFDFGGELHTPEHIKITADKVTQLETWLDALNDTLPPLKEFVLPRGNQAAAACHLARTICRRAERCLVRLHRQVALGNTEMLRYLNRLSDLLFVIARVLARTNDQTEEVWKHD